MQTEAEIRADEREKTLKVLASALRKFAPDTAAEIVERWAYCHLSDEEQLERLLLLLRANA